MDSRIKIFNQKVSSVVQYLEQGERLLAAGHTSSEKELNSIIDTAGRLLTVLEVYAKRASIYSTMKGLIQVLWNRYDKLAPRSTNEFASWVRSCLKLPLCIAEGVSVSDSKQEQLEVAEFTLVDRNGVILFHDVLNQDDSLMPHVWAQLLAAIEGRFMLSFDLVLTQIQLATVAHHYNLEVPLLIGGSLAPIFDLYFGVSSQKNTFMDGPENKEMFSSFPKENVSVIQDLPSETTLDRARGMLHVLNAIAQDSHEVGEGRTDDDTGQIKGKEE
ncbi:MAG: hypothetical protein PVS3B3_33020 [Ktedonobacteraceae bacterium]